MQKIYNKIVFMARRKELRKRQTPAEAMLWQRLKRKRFLGLRFLRQFSVDAYILDFYCPSLKLALELDGRQHDDAAQREYDRIRTDYLGSLAIRVVRFSNVDVLSCPEAILRAIQKTIPPLQTKRGPGGV